MHPKHTKTIQKLSKNYQKLEIEECSEDNRAVHEVTTRFSCEVAELLDDLGVPSEERVIASSQKALNMAT